MIVIQGATLPTFPCASESSNERVIWDRQTSRSKRTLTPHRQAPPNWLWMFISEWNLWLSNFNQSQKGSGTKAWTYCQYSSHREASSAKSQSIWAWSNTSTWPSWKDLTFTKKKGRGRKTVEDKALTQATPQRQRSTTLWCHITRIYKSWSWISCNKTEKCRSKNWINRLQLWNRRERMEFLSSTWERN